MVSWVIAMMTRIGAMITMNVAKVSRTCQSIRAVAMVVRNCHDDKDLPC